MCGHTFRRHPPQRSRPRSALPASSTDWSTFSLRSLGVRHWPLLPRPSGRFDFDYLQDDYPHLAVIFDVGRRTNQNSSVREYSDVVLSSAPIPINTPPIDPYHWFHPCPLLEWPYNTASLPDKPSDLFHTKAWDLIDSWWSTHSLLFEDAERICGKGEDFNFPYSDLPGGRDGLCVLNSEFHPCYADYVWDLEDYQNFGGKLRPQRRSAISDRCAWNTGRMLERARSFQFLDCAIIEELHFRGLCNRSVTGGHVLLVPNYKGLFYRGQLFFHAR